MINELDLLNVTEQAAIASYDWIGRGDKYSADFAATNAMKNSLNKAEYKCHIMFGEGIKDGMPGLFAGEIYGNIESNEVYDIVCDPLDGTTQTSIGGSEAVCTLAIAPSGSFFCDFPHYMNKLAYGRNLKESGISLDMNLNDIIGITANSLNKDKRDVVVCLLNRDRNKSKIDELRNIGCKIKLIADCDVMNAIAVGLPDSGIDLYMGIGGSPEGLLAASGLACLDGEFMAQSVDNELQPIGKIYSIKDLVKNDVIFIATGVTNGSLLKGVKRQSNMYLLNSVLMHSKNKTYNNILKYRN